MPTPWRQRQADAEFKTSLVYKVNSRTAGATQRNSVLKTTTKTNKQTNKKLRLFKLQGTMDGGGGLQHRVFRFTV